MENYFLPCYHLSALFWALSFNIIWDTSRVNGSELTNDVTMPTQIIFVAFQRLPTPKWAKIEKPTSS